MSSSNNLYTVYAYLIDKNGEEAHIWTITCVVGPDKKSAIEACQDIMWKIVGRYAFPDLLWKAECAYQNNLNVN